MAEIKSGETAAAETESHSFRSYISFKDCVGCKLFSTPILYLFGLHIALKNYNLFRQYTGAKVGKPVSKFDILGLFVVPLFCFVGGSVNLYLAAGILKNY